MKTLLEYKFHILAFVSTIAILGILVALGPKPASLNPEDLVLFYGNTCPHCKLLEDFIKENNVENKLTLVRKEVYENPINASMMAKAARACGLKSDTIGVPFLATAGKCFLGGDEIEKYLIERAQLTNVKESTSENK